MCPGHGYSASLKFCFFEQFLLATPMTLGLDEFRAA
ncbi:hypothetical protein PRUB_b6001 [Pseudoalteromonas rubra]|uniref:Uncharacterized protein n=1 Tax=Pseudoalteromonas rubra TaxID=43658 RepID=A0A8T0BZ65_9GAMM|nr:hypothetical protein PRUB_b6001 [Pseudoalteromonas rubra]